jgi:hypothetical protein
MTARSFATYYKLTFMKRVNVRQFAAVTISTQPSHSREANWSQPLTKFPEFCMTQKFITVLTKARHWSLSWTRWIRSIPPHHIRSSFTVSSYPSLDLPNGFFPSSLPTKTLNELISCACYMPCPYHSSYYIWRRLQVTKLLVTQFSPASYYFIPLGSKYLLSNVLSNTLNPCSSPNVRDQVSHPYKTTAKMTVSHNLIFMFLDNRQEDKRFWTEW